MKNLLLVIAFIYHLTATSQNDNLRISQSEKEVMKLITSLI